MDFEGDSVQSHSETEEDDYGCYFLQPSSSPYNIGEKVQKANVDLFSSCPLPINGKSAKVKFKDELVSFEPEDLTDDDVNSIESDHTDTRAEMKSPILGYKTTIIDQDRPNSIFDIEEIEEDDLEEEEIIEEIPGNEDLEGKIVENMNVSENSAQLQKATPETIRVESIRKSSKSSKRKKSCKGNFSQPHEVHCKEHCIDKLDFGLSMSIKKIEIHEKQVQLPPLQLLQRKCCDEVNHKSPKNLPIYNGYRSEYGLTSRQLAKVEKQKELMKQKEEMQQKLISEYRNRKIQQNEEVFCQWLKEVAKRKMEKHNNQKHKPKECVTPNIISLPNKIIENVKERPKTANEFVPKSHMKKRRRPHTTNSCVYIEVPHTVLEKGLNIGDLVVKNSKLFNRNNLHFFTIS